MLFTTYGVLENCHPSKYCLFLSESLYDIYSHRSYHRDTIKSIFSVVLCHQDNLSLKKKKKIVTDFTARNYDDIFSLYFNQGIKENFNQIKRYVSGYRLEKKTHRE